MLNVYRTPASHNDVIASPTPPTRPPRRYNPASPVTPTPPPRRHNIASPPPPATRPPRIDNNTKPTTPTRPPRRYNTASPITPTPPPRRENTTSLITPTPPPRRYNTASPITPTPPPRRDNTPSPITPTPPPRRYNTPSPIAPTRPPRVDNTASQTVPPQPPRSDVIGSPITTWRPPIPDIAASPTMPPWRPPRRDNTARPPQTPVRRVPPGMLNDYPAPPSPPNIVVSPTVRPPMDVTASLANGVILNATPARVEVGQKVRFELRFRRPPPPDLNIQYGFNFADSSPIEWTAVPRTTHPYSSLGTYEPSVEIRVGAKVLDLPKILGPTVQVVTPSSPTPTSTATSAPITPSPTSTYTPIATAAPTATSFISPTTPPPVRSSKMLWLYIAVGLGAVSLAYLVYQRAKLKIPIAARPTFYANSDWDAPQRPPKNLAINYGLYFHSNLSAGQDRLETDGASSILRKKTQ